MAKEKSDDPERAARKAEKKARREAKEVKRSETDGVHKSKKEKKHKNKPLDVGAGIIQTTTKIPDAVEREAPGSVVVKDDDEQKIEVKARPLLGALVPFALPLADERTTKKLLKWVKKANKNSLLQRGVKECLKSIRKSPTPSPSSAVTPPYICVLAGDISPMDVISHLPVLCEDHGIPYIFVSSRIDLGESSGTRRPTSVVLIGKEGHRKRREKPDGKDEGGETPKKEEIDGDWPKTFEEIVGLMQKAGADVRL